jgi:hypothetical protein
MRAVTCRPSGRPSSQDRLLSTAYVHALDKSLRIQGKGLGNQYPALVSVHDRYLVDAAQHSHQIEVQVWGDPQALFVVREHIVPALQSSSRSGTSALDQRRGHYDILREVLHHGASVVRVPCQEPLLGNALCEFSINCWHATPKSKSEPNWRIPAAIWLQQ